MATTRIKDLSESLALDSDMYIAADNEDGTKKVLAANLVDDTLTESGKFADAAAVGDALNEKVPKETGKGLSTEDFTTAEKTKLSGIEAGATNTVIDDTLTEEGQAADAKKTGDELNDLKDAIEQIETDKADTDGTYPDMTVGMAEQLDSDNYTEDSEPYHFRKSGGDRVRVGDREIDKIVGGTVAWNQLVNQLPSTQTIDGITFTNNNDGSISASGTATADIRLHVVIERSWASHIFFVSGCPKSGSASTFSLRMRGQGGDAIDVGNGVIWNASGNGWKACVIYIRNGISIATAIKYVPQIIDLTTAFADPAIADYIYQLEQSTAGAGVAFLRRYIDIDTYHPYDAGTLKSVEGLVSHDMVGWNQWDGTSENGKWIGDYTTGEIANTTSAYNVTGFIPVLPNTDYYKKKTGSYRNIFYDADKNVIPLTSWSIGDNAGVINTPSNAAYIRLTITNDYLDEFCINLSDPAKNGTYEPYEKHSYPLDSTVTLRGVPKLVDGKLVYDGDTYAADGTVTRNIKVYTPAESNITYSLNNSGYANIAYARIAKPNDAKAVNSASYFPLLVEGYPLSSATGQWDTADKVGYAFYGADTAYWCVGFRHGTTVEQMKTALAGKTVLYAATPTTEEAAPFTSPQWVDGSGTEQYVSTSLVPIGHYTQYPEDLKAKIEGLPWNFASLIAPTEATYKATQNYTSGSLLIVNNTLYKTTAAIANGGVITPGTNCTATTLAAVIAAL